MKRSLFKRTCPYCGEEANIDEKNSVVEAVTNHIESADGYQELEVQFVVCPNQECRKYTLSCILKKDHSHPDSYREEFKIPGSRSSWYDYRSIYKMGSSGEEVKRFRLIPRSSAKAFSDDVPRQIKEDYEEACLIVDLSPKAAASLARRCLQGMIRYHWGVVDRSLAAEIDAIEEKVEPDIWKAIDTVRKVGNIGAHMEKDVNLIIEIDANGAGQLIWLIEYLIEDWYITPARRKARLANIPKIAEEIEQQRRSAKPEEENNEDLPW